MSQTRAGRKAFWTVVACALLLAVAGTSAAGESVAAGGKGLPERPPTAGDIIPGRYIVTLRPGVSSKAVAARHRFRPAVPYEGALNGFAAELPPNVVNRLRVDRDVVSIQPDRVVTAADVPDCPTQTSPNPLQQCLPTGVDRIDVDLNTVANIDWVDDPMDVDIAIIDSGIQTNHPDLRVVGGARFLGPECNGTSYEDDAGHGTHVAGIAAAKDNDIGTVGVAPGARLWAVKVMDAGGAGMVSCVIAGVNWVTEHADTIEVANISLQVGGDPDPEIDLACEAITASAAKGVVYTVAAGNSQVDAGATSPAHCPDLLTVSAVTDYNGAELGGAPSPPEALCQYQFVDDTFAAEFSNFGPDVEVAAPGVCIYSTWIGSGYRIKTGTSMASPHVAGAAALDILVHGKPIDGSGAAAVRDRLVANAAPQGGSKGFIGDPDTEPENQEPLLYVAPLADYDAVAGSVSLPRPVVPDMSVPVTAQVLNNGTDAIPESLTVRLTASGGAVTGSPQTVNLASGGLAAVAFTWNTSGLAPGNYTLTSSVDAVAEDANLTNNSRDASVVVRTPEHDVAVTGVTVPPNVAAGSTSIDIDVYNSGTYDETFSLALFAAAGTVTDSPKSVNLRAETSSTLTFTWDTSLLEGAYPMNAIASQVPGETNTTDNASTLSASVSRATITVNSSADPGVGVCTENECTLREAINEANGAIGMNYLRFAIPTCSIGMCTITPASPLPDIADGIHIDGYTQPGASENENGTDAGSNAVLKIELSGALLNSGSYAGLNITGESSGSTIRGLAINRFSGYDNSSGYGIFLGGRGSNTVEGNFIGTNPAGTAALPNAEGVYVQSEYNTVGGTTPAARNVLSGNTGAGVSMNQPAAVNTSVQGNLIGTSASGTTAIGNGMGVKVSHGTNNTIGGTSSAARNVISGNAGPGVFITFFGIGNTIQGNFIGTDVTGQEHLGNSGAGVWVSWLAWSNTIGGTGSLEKNSIAYNYAGVVVSAERATGNVLRGNSIHSNSPGLGIDLADIVGWDPTLLGVTPNDTGDEDTGANGYQNFPLLGFVYAGSNSVRIDGYLNSTADAAFTLDFYSSPSCDSSGNGEGQTFLGSAAVATNATGDINFSATLSGLTLATGDEVTATATDAAGNTSEFSPCLPAVADHDDDGVYDLSDNCPTVANPGQENNDGDAQGDACDPDDDNDGLLDTSEPTSGCLPSGGGRLDPDCDNDNVSDGPNDPDGADPIVAGPDNCITTPNTNQLNTDGDSMGDACDPDDDNDTAIDASDNCQFIANPGQANNDGDAQGDACDPDDDNDTAIDASDNCQFTANPGQANNDGDAQGDACDPDDDNDGALDAWDLTQCGGDPLNAGKKPERIDGAFAGMDDDGDSEIDEPLPPGAQNYDCDGDGYTGLAESPTPLCGNGVNDDDKVGVALLLPDDAVIDDGCPGGPAQVGAFSEAQFKIGTNDQDPCGTNGWPSDIVTGGIPDSTNKVNILDITSFIAPARHLDTAPGNTLFDKRWDLIPGRGVFNNMINVTDLTSLTAGTGGFPPMLGGEKASGGPSCPWPQ